MVRSTPPERAVVRHLVGGGVELRRLGLTGEQARTVSDMYLEGLTLVEIAARLEVAASTVRRSLHGQGVVLRPPGRRRIA